MFGKFIFLLFFHFFVWLLKFLPVVWSLGFLNLIAEFDMFLHFQWAVAWRPRQYFYSSGCKVLLLSCATYPAAEHQRHRNNCGTTSFIHVTRVKMSLESLSIRFFCCCCFFSLRAAGSLGFPNYTTSAPPTTTPASTSWIFGECFPVSFHFRTQWKNFKDE